MIEVVSASPADADLRLEIQSSQGNSSAYEKVLAVNSEFDASHSQRGNWQAPWLSAASWPAVGGERCVTYQGSFTRGFPGTPVVRALYLHCWGPVFNPCLKN